MLFLLAPFVFLSVAARMLNVTIDDTLGDARTGAIPQYGQSWRARSVGGAPCNECRAQPDGARAFKGTWHDKSTYEKDPRATVSLEFSGSRIYVFFILFNDIGTSTKDTRLKFYLDGSPDSAGDFLHPSDAAGEPYLYNQLVFDSQSLELGNHTLLISSYSDGESGSLALFDYAVYTMDDASHPETPQVPGPPSDNGGGRSSPSAAVIGGSVAGGLVAALLLGVAFWLYVRRRRRNGLSSAQGPVMESYAHDVSVEPFAPPPASYSDAQSSLERGYMERASKAPLLSPSPPRSTVDPAQLRHELDGVREELERVRRIAEPPDYTHVSRDSPVP
ncbi:hypothetical protein AURDEDRAFT_188607 [Auricularia subglabra TFB-10046 SS5]|nr:hypothetical protein AURDEDRAFT_188607 [Auricularia subglabra TFB-10046 SS5]